MVKQQYTQKDAHDIHEYIKMYSLSIAEQLKDLNMLDVKAVSDAIAIRMNFCIKECIRIYATEINDERAALSAEYADPETPNWKKAKIASQLTLMKEKSRKANKLFNTMQDNSLYINLKKFLIEKGMLEYVQEFQEKFQENTSLITKASEPT